MTRLSTARVLRLGTARKLTRAVTQGEHFELNSQRKYDVPPTE